MGKKKYISDLKWFNISEITLNMEIAGKIWTYLSWQNQNFKIDEEFKGSKERKKERKKIKSNLNSVSNGLDDQFFRFKIFDIYQDLVEVVFNLEPIKQTILQL
jgi:hypothetical protein